MNFVFKFTQTISKYIEIEANDESEALDKANNWLEEGEIHFDDENFLRMECNITAVSPST